VKILLLFLIPPAAAPEETEDSPWGVAPSHSSSRGIEGWAPAIAKTGVRWIRGFYQDDPDRVLGVAERNGFRVAGILQWSPKGRPASFPADALPEWKAYVAGMIRRTRGRVRHWEVWNEPPNFSRSKSPADYAKIVAAAYETAKEVDPEVQVGLAAQSVNLNFLAQALDAGAAGRFDYVTVHPYEVMDLVARGWEPQFLSIVPTIRRMLADKSPSRRNVPVWITEVGQPVGKEITPERQADTLVKAFVLGLAQGMRRIHWFEAVDGDSGPFGLIAGGRGDGPRRPSFTALARLVRHLGHAPRFVGWTLLEDRHPVFLFEGPEGPVAAAWAAPGAAARVSFGAPVRLLRPHGGAEVETESVDLTNSPVLILGVPPGLVERARAGRGRPFPWGGDYTGAASVRWEAPGIEKGLHPLRSGRVAVVEGQEAWDLGGTAELAFAVDPNFLSYETVPLKITAVLRRQGGKGAGFNLKYESTSGFRGTGSWYTLPEGDAWVTQSWTIRDPQFVGKWGYHFSFDSDSERHTHYWLRSVTVSRE